MTLLNVGRADSSEAVFWLPGDIITQTLAILAVKRAGKSNAAVVIAEEMFNQGLPWVAVDPKGDWYGIRAGQHGEPGLAVLVLGGAHGDVPLEPTSGKVVAEFLVAQRVTCVLDVSEFSRADQRRFLTDFAERLYRINTEPLMVFCEEADEYIPQRVMSDQARLVGAFETLVKRGGFKGLGVCLITQRSASLNKDVLTQIETLIVLRTPSPQDRKAILGWVETHAIGKEAVDELPGLENGEAWVFSPQWLKIAGAKMRFRRRYTFDSGATPEIGSIRLPAVLADVDITALQRAMQATIERAQQEDPRALQGVIHDLTRQLAEARSQQREVAVFTQRDHELLGKVQEAVSEFQAGVEAMYALGARVEQALERTGAAVRSPGWMWPSGESPDPPPPAQRQPSPPPPAARQPERRIRIPASTTMVSTTTVGNGHVEVNPTAQRLLDALVWWLSIGIETPTRTQISLIAAFGIGGRFNGELALLQQAGLVEYPGPGLVRATDAGRGRSRPMGIAANQAAFLERIFAKLHQHDAAMLKVLINAYPDAQGREVISARTGHRIGGTFNHALSRLQKLGLVEYPGPGMVRATEVLFPFRRAAT